MAKWILNLPEELHEKLRWLAFKHRRSQKEIVIEILERSLEHIQPPKEDDDGRKSN